MGKDKVGSVRVVGNDIIDGSNFPPAGVHGSGVQVILVGYEGDYAEVLVIGAGVCGYCVAHVIEHGKVTSDVRSSSAGTKRGRACGIKATRAGTKRATEIGAVNNG